MSRLWPPFCRRKERQNGGLARVSCYRVNHRGISIVCLYIIVDYSLLVVLKFRLVYITHLYLYLFIFRQFIDAMFCFQPGRKRARKCSPLNLRRRRAPLQTREPFVFPTRAISRKGAENSVKLPSCFSLVITLA